MIKGTIKKRIVFESQSKIDKLIKKEQRNALANAALEISKLPTKKSGKSLVNSGYNLGVADSIKVIGKLL